MRILLIEDEHDVANLLKVNLEAELFSVDICYDGQEGYLQAKSNDYDLIILDYFLPTKKGDEICAALRAEGKTTPILLLSIESQISTKVDLLNFGADDYITKPFSFPELLARVKALLRRPQTLNADILRIGDLVVDTNKHFVKRGDKHITLTRKELQLLEYMIRNKGKVLSRGMIMEHVWDKQGDVFSNTIETHILNLRKKVDDGHDTKLIKTISGRGYKVEEQV